MSVTPNMNLSLPVPTVTLGPAWAAQLNTALNLVDDHDHTTGKGRRVPTAGLLINADLSIGSNNLNLVKSVRMTDQVATLVGAEDIRSVYVVNGDLYYNNSTGTAVQITSGSAVNAVSDGISRSFENTLISSSPVTIAPSDTFSFVGVNTTAARTINLPAAASVAAGRFFEFKDATGTATTYNVTITPNGSDTIDNAASSVAIVQNYGSFRLVSDGVSNWMSNRSSVTPANYAISSSCGNFTWNASVTINQEMAVTNLSCSITTSGNPVRIGVISDGTGTTSNQITSSLTMILPGGVVQDTPPGLVLIYRGSTAIATLAVPSKPGSSNDYWSVSPTFIQHFDPVGAGTYTYSIKLGTNYTTNWSFNNSKLVVQEI